MLKGTKPKPPQVIPNFISFSSRKLTKFPGLQKIQQYDSLNFSSNPIQSLSTLQTVPNLKSLTLDNTQIETFELANPQPSLTSISFKNTPLSRYKFAHIMTLIVYGEQLEKINGCPVLKKDIKQADLLRKLILPYLLKGWLLMGVDQIRIYNPQNHNRLVLKLSSHLEDEGKAKKTDENEESQQTIDDNVSEASELLPSNNNNSQVNKLKKMMQKSKQKEQNHEGSTMSHSDTSEMQFDDSQSVSSSKSHLQKANFMKKNLKRALKNRKNEQKTGNQDIQDTKLDNNDETKDRINENIEDQKTEIIKTEKENNDDDHFEIEGNDEKHCQGKENNQSPTIKNDDIIANKPHLSLSQAVKEDINLSNENSSLITDELLESNDLMESQNNSFEDKSSISNYSQNDISDLNLPNEKLAISIPSSDNKIEQDHESKEINENEPDNISNEIDQTAMKDNEAENDKNLSPNSSKKNQNSDFHSEEDLKNPSNNELISSEHSEIIKNTDKEIQILEKSESITEKNTVKSPTKSETKDKMDFIPDSDYLLTSSTKNDLLILNFDEPLSLDFSVSSKVSNLRVPKQQNSFNEDPEDDYDNFSDTDYFNSEKSNENQIDNENDTKHIQEIDILQTPIQKNHFKDIELLQMSSISSILSPERSNEKDSVHTPINNAKLPNRVFHTPDIESLSSFGSPVKYIRQFLDTSDVESEFPRSPNSHRQIYHSPTLSIENMKFVSQCEQFSMSPSPSKRNPPPRNIRASPPPNPTFVLVTINNVDLSPINISSQNDNKIIDPKENQDPINVDTINTEAHENQEKTENHEKSENHDNNDNNDTYNANNIDKKTTKEENEKSQEDNQKNDNLPSYSLNESSDSFEAHEKAAFLEAAEEEEKAEIINNSNDIEEENDYNRNDENNNEEIKTEEDKDEFDDDNDSINNQNNEDNSNNSKNVSNLSKSTLTFQTLEEPSDSHSEQYANIPAKRSILITPKNKGKSLTQFKKVTFNFTSDSLPESQNADSSSDITLEQRTNDNINSDDQSNNSDSNSDENVDKKQTGKFNNKIKLVLPKKHSRFSLVREAQIIQQNNDSSSSYTTQSESESESNNKNNLNNSRKHQISQYSKEKQPKYLQEKGSNQSQEEPVQNEYETYLNDEEENEYEDNIQNDNTETNNNNSNEEEEIYEEDKEEEAINERYSSNPNHNKRINKPEEKNDANNEKPLNIIKNNVVLRFPPRSLPLNHKRFSLNPQRNISKIPIFNVHHVSESEKFTDYSETSDNSNPVKQQNNNFNNINNESESYSTSASENEQNSRIPKRIRKNYQSSEEMQEEEEEVSYSDVNSQNENDNQDDNASEVSQHWINDNSQNSLIDPVPNSFSSEDISFESETMIRYQNSKELPANYSESQSFVSKVSTSDSNSQSKPLKSSNSTVRSHHLEHKKLKNLQHQQEPDQLSCKKKLNCM